MNEFRPGTAGDLPALRRLWQDLFFTHAYAPERSLLLIRGGAPAGAAYWFGCTMGSRRLAYLYAVAVSPEHQGKGLGSAMMDALHQTLAAQGYDAVLLVPGEEGLRQFYGRFGYRTCSYRPDAVALPPLEPVTPAQYARIRRTLLPENGVIQEGENLAFLSCLADFYRGEQCLAALSRLDGSCLELLGQPAAGTRLPYAMGKSLTADPLPEEILFSFGFD